MTTMLIGETRFRLIRFDRDWRGIEEDEMLGKKRAIGKMLLGADWIVGWPGEPRPGTSIQP